MAPLTGIYFSLTPWSCACVSATHRLRLYVQFSDVMLLPKRDVLAPDLVQLQQAKACHLYFFTERYYTGVRGCRLLRNWFVEVSSQQFICRFFVNMIG